MADVVSDIVHTEFHDIPGSGLTHLAIMQSLGSLHETVKRIDDRQGRLEKELTSIGTTVRETDRRVLIIESNSVDSRVTALELTVKALSDKDSIRIGHQQAFAALRVYGPLMISLVLVIVVMAQAGIIKFGG
jgi:hypothetical protein